ncbi:MAG: hypothetical protein COA70_10830 [Planctomycetota bacterium]|nr:MAG: hypothetical protein COA70_10830 [Planctomycetota bacterium]
MLLKWIVCQVAKQDHDAFAVSQEAWKGMANEPGFLGQCGGWKDAKTACILGLWENAEAQHKFLTEGSHDSILSGSQQGEVLKSWTTTLLEQRFPMPGQFPDLQSALDSAPEAAFLRVADCWVPPEQKGAFLKAQESTWLPAMQKANGMLGGAFCSDDVGRFMVVTLWQSEKHHQRYAEEDLPKLLKRISEKEAVPHRLKGYAFPLQRSWTVR